MDSKFITFSAICKDCDSLRLLLHKCTSSVTTSRDVVTVVVLGFGNEGGVSIGEVSIVVDVVVSGGGGAILF